ncbi:MAG: LysR family transcriptional regulator [Amaricoccus sp.]
MGPMPLRFTLRQLEYLVAVGEAGSIAQAAERVNVSAPSISTAIAQLEAEFGLPLFTRKHAHGLTLSTGGRAFLAQAKAVLAAAEALGNLASDLAGSVRGPLGIGCLLTFAQLVLPELRRGFESRFPDVRVRQYELDHAEILEKLRIAEIDAGLTYDLEIPRDIRFEPLAELPPWIMLAPTDPLAGRPIVHPEDLAGRPMVLLDLPHSADYFLSAFARTGLRPRIAERTRDMSVARALVANGFGYGLINARSESDRAPDGKRLAFVPLGGLRAMRLGLAHPGGAHRSPTVAAFLDHCRALIAAQGLPGLWRP